MSIIIKIVIVFIAIVIIFSKVAYGNNFDKTNNLDSANSDFLNRFTQNLINECSSIFDTGDITSIQSNFCTSIMDSIDQQCRDNYFDFCFGVAWSNYDFNHKSIKDHNN